MKNKNVNFLYYLAGQSGKLWELYGIWNAQVSKVGLYIGMAILEESIIVLSYQLLSLMSAPELFFTTREIMYVYVPWSKVSVEVSNCKHIEFLLMRKWISKTCLMHTMLYYTTVRSNLFEVHMATQADIKNIVLCKKAEEEN